MRPRGHDAAVLGNVEAAYLGIGRHPRKRVRMGGSGVDMSTIDPGHLAAGRRPARGAWCAVLDAPVSGGVGGAVAGTLAIMVGGDAGDLEEARPVLAAMGSNIIHVGAVGAGARSPSCCNNLISGSALIAVAEAFRIGEAFGVDPEILTRVIIKSSGATGVMEHMHRVPGIVDSAASSRQYAPGFMTDLMAKDLGLAVSAAREKRVPVVVAPAAQQLYRMALVAWARPRGFLVGLQVSEAVERRRLRFDAIEALSGSRRFALMKNGMVIIDADGHAVDYEPVYR